MKPFYSTHQCQPLYATTFFLLFDNFYCHDNTFPSITCGVLTSIHTSITIRNIFCALKIDFLFFFIILILSKVWVYIEVKAFILFRIWIRSKHKILNPSLKRICLPYFPLLSKACNRYISLESIPTKTYLETSTPLTFKISIR